MPNINTTKIFCLGDGYAHGHIWPEWPQLLQALLPSHEFVLITGIGAGNEFLINGLLNHDISNSTVIFQWAQYNRFDKILQDDQWNSIIDNDKSYGFNTVQRNGVRWWLSSRSTSEEIVKYHKFYLQSSQAETRMLDQQKLVHAYVNYHHANYIEISTQDQFWYSLQEKFNDARRPEVQPSPVIHWAYLNERIIPNLNVSIDAHRKRKLENLINTTPWVPFDIDQANAWSHAVSQLD